MIDSTIIGFMAGALCTISFIPQVLKIYKTKTAGDLSLVTFSIFALGVFLWIVYGFSTKAMPVIITNIVVFILALAIVVMKVKYDD